MELLLQRAPDRTTALTTAALAFPRNPDRRYYRLQNWVSDALPTPRDLFLWLPAAYLEQPERRFPVLLLHDGQNLFDGDLSYVRGQTWQCGSTADDVFARGLAEPVVLVGIGNTGVQRMAEYTPTPDTRLGGGKGPLYSSVLTEELLPALHRDLRLLPGPEHTGIAGSSLGGLISLAIGLREPQVFGKLGILSPSVWWDRRTILDDVRSLTGHLPLRIWLDMGTAARVGTQDSYLSASTTLNQPIYASFAQDRFGRSTLPRQFTLPSNDNPRGPESGGIFFEF